MAALTLYLDNTATASPFPTTSKKLVTSAPASEVQLGPGEFDSGFPGTTDSGQWNPSSPIGDTTAAAEIDNVGAVLGVTRQGWLYDVDVTGRKLKAGSWTVQLRLRANQGTGTSGRIAIRVTVVTGLAAAWVTAANLLTTSIVGEASHSTGQEGWRSQTDARITVTSTAANFSVTVGDSGTSATHTFASGERLLVEFGFGDGNSTADRTWRLDYNQASSLVVTPDIVDPIAGVVAGTSTVAGTLTADGALAGAVAGTSTVSGTLTAQAGGAIEGVVAGTSTVSGTLTADGALAAIVAGTSTVGGMLTGDGALAAVVAGTSTVSGTLVGEGALAGTTSGTSTVSGTLTADGALAAVVAGTSTVVGTLGGEGALAGVVAGTSSVAGTLSGSGVGALAASVAGTSTTGGTLTGYAPPPPPVPPSPAPVVHVEPRRHRPSVSSGFSPIFERFDLDVVEVYRRAEEAAEAQRATELRPPALVLVDARKEETKVDARQYHTHTHTHEAQRDSLVPFAVGVVVGAILVALLW